MKKISVVIVLLVAFVIMSGCQKEPINNDNKANNDTNPLVEMLRAMNFPSADFYVMVSSSYGVSVYGPGSSSQEPSTVIAAESLTKNNVGELTVNGVTLPFNGQNYSMECDTSSFLPSMVVGRMNNYRLSGQGFPSFDINQYSPEANFNMTFEGIVDYKLPRKASLTLNWLPDEKLPDNSRAGMIIFAEDEISGVHKIICENVSDKSGSYTLSASDLALFDNYSNVRVIYVRGYDKLYIIGNRTIDLRFISFNDAWFNFSS